jgi:hypothetical protein
MSVEEVCHPKFSFTHLRECEVDSPDFFLDLKKHPILIASGANGFGGFTS